MTFLRGLAGINMVLRRAAISGRVQVEPFDGRMDYFADVQDEAGNLLQSILLDENSYRALKNRWMRCKQQTGGEI